MIAVITQDVLKQDQKEWSSKINDSLLTFLRTRFSNCEDQRQLFEEIGIQR